MERLKRLGVLHSFSFFENENGSTEGGVEGGRTCASPMVAGRSRLATVGDASESGAMLIVAQPDVVFT